MTRSTKSGDNPTQLWQRVGAEMIGTFALVFLGCGAIVVDELTGGAIGHLGVSLTFGFVIMVMVCATGHVCGAHFNPAVTLAFAVIGRFPWRDVAPYIAGQLVAAALAAGLLRVAFGAGTNLGATEISLGFGATGALGLEIALTFFLMFVIVSVATDSRAMGETAGWAIGGTVALCSIFGGPVTGSSMNPARTLGPALASGTTGDLWLYIVGPIAGAAFGALAYKAVGRSTNDAAGAA